ncbi:MAG TPA: hypothetical protein EYQ58_02370 [Candidatus Poseidoniales archaeon]|nr:hypothetical protein [Candidatus Poseidoniales archaeon]
MVHNDSKDLLDERKAGEKKRRNETHEEGDCFRKELAKKKGGNWKRCLRPYGIPATHIQGPDPSKHWAKYPKDENDCCDAVLIYADEFVMNGGTHNDLLDTIWLYEKRCGHQCRPGIYYILGNERSMGVLRAITPTGQKGVKLSGFIKGVNTHRMEPVTVIAIRDKKPQEQRYI